MSEFYIALAKVEGFVHDEVYLIRADSETQAAEEAHRLGRRIFNPFPSDILMKVYGPFIIDEENPAFEVWVG